VLIITQNYYIPGLSEINSTEICNRLQKYVKKAERYCSYDFHWILLYWFSVGSMKQFFCIFPEAGKCHLNEI